MRLGWQLVAFIATFCLFVVFINGKAQQDRRLESFKYKNT